jgi:hypothetical protein
MIAALQNPAISAPALASQRGRETGPILFITEDWTAFRTVDGLCRRAGVAPQYLRRLVLKELVDNALDAVAGSDAVVKCDVRSDGSMVVTDDGPGIPGEPTQIAALFSIRRPLTSSKLLRRPTRGALGNGLRVVAGAVLASGGHLEVWTRNRRLTLTPRDDGETAVTWEPITFPTGTGIVVRLGPAIPRDPVDVRLWATDALLLGDADGTYRGKSSPHWFDADSFFELLQAAGQQPVRTIIAQLDGCSGKTAAIVGDLAGRAANSLSRDEATALLTRARAQATTVPPKRLGLVGRLATLPEGYAKEMGELTTRASRGGAGAVVPCIIEAWARRSEEDTLTVCVNRTPITGEIAVRRQRDKTLIGVFGCGLQHAVQVGTLPVELYLNVTTPYMPITSDGKAPDLARFLPLLTDAMAKAARRTKKAAAAAGPVRTSDKAWILDQLEAGIDHAGGGGQLRFSQRQLYYAVRDFIKQANGPEPSWENFCKVLTEYEASVEDLQRRGLYRDTRGLVYHPHTHTTIPLGTLSVEAYARPAWLFNKVLYCEKEGFFPTLIDSGWPERHDCALLTSKGFATRAARDLLDLLGDGGEPITFFCVHDADAAGTLIYQSLQEATQARPGRTVNVINLGLDPDEAINAGLPVEPVSYKKRQPVGDYAADRGDWLQTHRVELNAMTSPQFLIWLDEKIAPHDTGKVVPPRDVITERLTDDAEALVRERLAARILADAGFDAQVADIMATLEPTIQTSAQALPDTLRAAFDADPTMPWTAPVREHAETLAALTTEEP